MSPTCPLSYEELDTLLSQGHLWEDRLAKVGHVLRLYLTEVAPRVVHSNTQLTDAVLKWSGCAKPGTSPARRKLSSFITSAGRQKKLFGELITDGPEFRSWNRHTESWQVTRARYWRFVRPGETTINEVPQDVRVKGRNSILQAEPNANGSKLYTAAEVAIEVGKALHTLTHGTSADVGRYCFSCGRGVKKTTV